MYIEARNTKWDVTCQQCPDNITSRMWLVKIPNGDKIMCDWCKEDFAHNPMKEILPIRNAFICWLRRKFL